MPLYTTKAPPIILAIKGPLLPVRVRLPDVVARLRNANPAVTGMGLIDTGASRTCISKKVVAALALKSAGAIQVGGVGGAKEHSLCRVTFEFVDGLPPAAGVDESPSVKPVITVSDWEVLETDIDVQGLAMLIGRDVLAYSGLTYDGPTGIWTLEIPRTKPPSQPEMVGPPQSDATAGESTRSTSHDYEKAKAARKTAKKARKKNRGK